MDIYLLTDNFVNGIQASGTLFLGALRPRSAKSLATPTKYFWPQKMLHFCLKSKRRGAAGIRVRATMVWVSQTTGFEKFII
jgi:hypothetical protein